MDSLGGSIDIKALQRYMGVLSDLRRSSTMICDSIRTRELNALSILGVDTGVPDNVDASNDEPVKCSVCMTEFEDPSVVITRCGHGLHEKCMETLKKRHDNGSTDSSILYPCPLCRTKFRRENVIKLIGMLPCTGRSAIWRSIQLSAPWKVPRSGEANISVSTTELDSLPEKLYISLRALFRHTHELDRLFETVLRLHEESVQIKSETLEEKKKIINVLSERESRLKEKWDVRMKRLEEREGKLVCSEHQNEVLLVRCMKAVKREEDSNLSLLESLLAKQKELDRTREELVYKQEKVDAALKDLKKSKQSHEKSIREKEEQIRSERRRIASERNMLMLRSQSQNAANEMRNPAFSDPEDEESISDGDVDIIDEEDSRGPGGAHDDHIGGPGPSSRTRFRLKSPDTESKRHRAQ